MDWDMVIGVAATVIALCALGLSIYQSGLTRRHNKLSVKPHIATWINTDTDSKTYQAGLVNNGLGPAIIIDFRIRVDGALVQGKGTEPVEAGIKSMFPAANYHAKYGSVAPGYSMAANERCMIVSIEFRGDHSPQSDEIEAAFDKASIEVKYEYLYGDRFVLNTDESQI